jgi:hypothetical protein
VNNAGWTVVAVGEAGEPVDAGDQDVADPAGLQVVAHLNSELCAFGLLEQHAEHVALAVVDYVLEARRNSPATKYGRQLSVAIVKPAGTGSSCWVTWAKSKALSAECTQTTAAGVIELDNIQRRLRLTGPSANHVYESRPDVL